MIKTDCMAMVRVKKGKFDNVFITVVNSVCDNCDGFEGSVNWVDKWRVYCLELELSMSGNDYMLSRVWRRVLFLRATLRTRQYVVY